jgi:RimJ/RimL family protein N-acetyltransferase
MQQNQAYKHLNAGVYPEVNSMNIHPLLHRDSEDDAQVTSLPVPHHAPSVIVPIREIGPRYRERIASHLLGLEPRDRYLRFGFAANDEQIHRYVDGLNFERDRVFGIFNRKLELIAMAHLAHADELSATGYAEFGVSVSGHVRGRGYGTRLFERAAIYAVNDGVKTLYIHALSENIAMLRIARNAGAVVERAGSESEAYLTLPEASFRSRLGELFGNQVGQADYLLKAEISLVRGLFGAMQESLENVREDRRKAGF